MGERYLQDEPFYPCGPDCTGPGRCSGCEAYERYYAELEAEQARLDALPRVKGHPAVRESGECDRCGKTAVLYDLTACTLGYPGHPGAEYTAFQVCAECLA